MTKISAHHRIQTILAIQSGDWMIDPLWAMANMDFFEKIEKNDPSLLAGFEDFSREELLPKVFGLDNFSITSPMAVKYNEAPEGSIMMMQVHGPIFRYGEYWTYGTEDYISWLESARDNTNIEGVFVKVNSPGGQVAAMNRLFSLVNDFPKPIVVWIDRDMMASSAAYGFIGADRVFASHKTDSVGSFGVYTRIRDLRKRYEEYGIVEFNIYAPQSTEKNADIRELFEKGKTDLIEAKLAFIAENLIDDVILARGDKLKEVKGMDWKKGRLFNAEQGLEIGLIDGIVSEDDAIVELVSIINQNKTGFTMFGDKHKIITALQGVAAADVTEEKLNEINAHLDGLNIKGVRVVTAAIIDEAEAAVTNLAAVTKERDEFKVKADALVTVTKERDEWKTKAEAFGDQPGETPSSLKKKEEEEKIKGDNPYLSATDVALAAFKAYK